MCQLPPITQHREHYCYLKFLTASSSYHKTFKSLTTNIMMLGISSTTAVSSAFDLHCSHVSDTEKPHALGIQPTSQHSPQEAGVNVILARCRPFSRTNLMMLPTLSCKPVAVCLIMPLPRHSLAKHPIFLKHKHNHPFFYFFALPSSGGLTCFANVIYLC